MIVLHSLGAQNIKHANAIGKSTDLYKILLRHAKNEKRREGINFL